MQEQVSTDGGTLVRYRVGSVDDIAEASGALVDIGGVEVGVFRYQGRFVAYANRCVHQGGPVCTGELLGATKVDLTDDKEVIRERLDESEMRLVCPWHGWEYDLATGQVAHNRRLRLRQFDVTVEEGMVYIDA